MIQLQIDAEDFQVVQYLENEDYEQVQDIECFAIMFQYKTKEKDEVQDLIKDLMQIAFDKGIPFGTMEFPYG